MLLLALIQGLTEFLPVSSSGHLVILRHLTGLKGDEVTLEVVLHFGTFVAVVVFFRKKIVELLVSAFKGNGQGRAWILAIIVGSMPAAVVGLFLERAVEGMFSSTLVPGICLIITGLFLLLLGNPRRGGGKTTPSLFVSLVVGIAQAFAVLPGISRSGATIIAGLQTGMEKRTAGEYSFLLSLPVVAGAALFKLKDIGSAHMPVGYLVSGFLVSAVVGFGCLSFLMWILEKGKLRFFSPWCFFAGAVALIAYF